MDDNSPKEKQLAFEKYKFNWSLAKWAVGFFVLIFITNAIDNSFKERAAGIQEMQAFDKYVDLITNADNPKGRWQLAVFFSIVTTTDRLRNGWIAYKDSIKPEYDAYVALQRQQDSARRAFHEGKDPNAFLKLNQITNQIESYQKTLSGHSSQQQTAGSSNSLTIPDTILKKFRESIERDSTAMKRFSTNEMFKKANDINTSVVLDLIADLGPSYESIQSGINYNFKEYIFTNQFGIQSIFDHSKKIWPIFQAKFVSPEAVFTLTENGITVPFKSPISNIDWNGLKQFIRKFYTDRIGQLR